MNVPDVLLAGYIVHARKVRLMSTSIRNPILFLKRWKRSSLVVIGSAILGLMFLFLPWVVIRGTGLWNRGQIGYISGVELLVGWDPQYSILLFVFACIFTLLTAFPSKITEKYFSKPPIYLFYTFVALLALVDVHYWLGRSRGFIPEATAVYNSGIGFSLSAITIVGILAGAIIGCVEKFPFVKSLSGLITGVLAGALIQFSFFSMDWIFRPLRYVSGYGLTGYELAYQYWHTRLENVAIPIIDSLIPYWNFYFWPFILYFVPILGALTMISPFLSLRININRIVRVASGSGLLIVCFIFISNISSGIFITQGVWFTTSMGLFLIVVELLLYLTERAKLKGVSQE